VHAGTHAQHEHCRRAVDRVTGTHLLRAGLQVIFQTRVIPRVRCSQYGKDAAHRHVDVDIRRAVEGIEGQQILPPRVLRGQPIGLLEFLRHHSGEVPSPLCGAQKVVVGNTVELLLDLALHVRVVRGAEHPAECPECHPIRDRLTRQRDIKYQPVEIPTRARVTPPLLDEELYERRVIGEHCLHLV
jgi:hypothetical protein